MDYRRLTRSLIAKVRDLQEEIDGLQEYAYAEQEPCIICERSQETIRQQDSMIRNLEGELRDAQDRSYRLQDAVASLKRAQRNGDQWGASRALQHLKTF